jgi:Protein of unknown function (DUF4038)/Putative collagen-binding domain of a collagenase
MSGKFPLTIASGKRYLVDQFGVPFQIRGDSGWGTGYAIDPSVDLYQYFEDRRARGFNSSFIYMAVGGNFGAFDPNNWNNVPPFNFDLSGNPLTNTSTQLADFSTYNTAYFSNFDNVFSLAAQYGIQLFFFFSYLGAGGGNQGWYNHIEANSNAKLQAFGNYLGQHYANTPNLIWVAGGDYNPPDQTKLTTLTNAILAFDSNHLVCSHPGDGTNGATEYGTNAWLTLDTVYTDVEVTGIYVSTNMQASYTGQSRPCVTIEDCYLNDHLPAGTPQVVRAQHWASLLNGGMGYFYGSGGSTPPEPLYSFLSGWQSLLGDEGALDATQVNNLFASREWWLLVPDISWTFLTNGASYSGANFASAAQASDGSWACIYTPANQSLTVALSGFSRRVGAFWVDPTTGSRRAAINGTLGTTGSHTFAATPGNNANGDADWVLLFEAPLNTIYYGGFE